MTQLRNDPAAWPLLEERARALATRETTATTAAGDEHLIFRLGDDGYSLPAQYIREIQPLRAYTPLPSTPAFVVGLVNLRGRLLAALDIRPLLEIAAAPPQPLAFLLVLTANGVEVGLMADTVVEIRRSDEQLAPVLSAAAGRGSAWIRGIDRRPSLLIDPPALLADPRLLVSDAPQ